MFTPIAGALAPLRLAEPFERFRDISDAMLAKAGSRPKVYLAALGPEPAHRSRIAFVREWLDAGGFETVYDGETASADKAVEGLRASGAPLACLCGDDKAYARQAEAFAERSRLQARRVFVACGPARRRRSEMARRRRR